MERTKNQVPGPPGRAQVSDHLTLGQGRQRLPIPEATGGSEAQGSTQQQCPRAALPSPRRNDGARLPAALPASCAHWKTHPWDGRVASSGHRAWQSVAGPGPTRPLPVSAHRTWQFGTKYKRSTSESSQSFPTCGWESLSQASS